MNRTGQTRAERKLTFTGRVKSLNLLHEAIHAVLGDKRRLGSIGPTIRKGLADLLTQRSQILGHLDEIVQHMRHQHGASMHDSQTHDNEQVMCHEVRILVAWVIRQINHPLQKVIRFLVIRVIGFRMVPRLDHGDEQLLLGELGLSVELAHAGEEPGDDWSQELGDGTQEDDGDADVDGVVGDGLQPLFVSADGFADDDARSGPGDQTEEHVVCVDRNPFICICHVSCCCLTQFGFSFVFASSPSHLGTSTSNAC